MKLTFRTACSTLTELIAARTAELRRAEPELARLLDRSEVQEGRPVRSREARWLERQVRR